MDATADQLRPLIDFTKIKSVDLRWFAHNDLRYCVQSGDPDQGQHRWVIEVWSLRTRSGVPLRDALLYVAGADTLDECRAWISGHIVADNLGGPSDFPRVDAAYSALDRFVRDRAAHKALRVSARAR